MTRVFANGLSGHVQLTHRLVTNWISEQRDTFNRFSDDFFKNGPFKKRLFEKSLSARRYVEKVDADSWCWKAQTWDESRWIEALFKLSVLHLSLVYC